MKRIKIETADGTLLAKPLTLDQLEEHEGAINAITKDSAALGKSPGSMLPIALLKKQAKIVLLALRNHDAATTDKVTGGMSILEITSAFASVLSGSGLEEVQEGEVKAG